MAITLSSCWYGSRILPSTRATSRNPLCSHATKDLFRRGNEAIREWTPFLLVASYFVFSICMYTFCTETMIKMFWFIYLMTNFYIAGSTFLESVMSVAPTRDARKAVQTLENNDWTFPTPDNDLLILDLIIVGIPNTLHHYCTVLTVFQVAYLPNEMDIIQERIQYALDEIVYPAHKIRINLVYNTPRPIEPLETQLEDLTFSKPNFRLFKVAGSTSKADNLNYFLSLKLDSDIVCVFDADHYPHPYGPRWAVERFIQDQETSVVQGRCVVYNSRASWLSAMIAVEFDKIYAVSHPGRTAIWGFGLFTGSNGYWRTSLLQDLKMDGAVLTEDIDSSMRAISEGAKIVHDLNVVSYELAPTTIPALWKQRLRWAQGWTQVSIKHSLLTFRKSKNGSLSPKFRFGILSLLLIREASYYLVTQYTCLVVSMLFTNFPKNPINLAKFIFFPFPLSKWLFIAR